MTKFADLKLDPNVLKAVAEAGYDNPTPIQAGAIPPALEGRDVLGIAQTGTGKTASFTLPMITLLGRGRARARMPRSLVLCPTRELAAQVAENFDTYAKYTRLTKALLIGGVSFNEQDKLIDRGVDVLIATPGRLLDHFERGKLLLTGVQIMVVDEADRMLDMGFIPDIERIFQLTPFTRQTLFFSATMAPEIERITDTFLHAPERIEVARQATTSETITQRLVEIIPTRKDQSAKQKRELLRALIDAEGPETETGGLKNAIIFCNRKTDVDIVAKSLKAHGYDAAPIHGDLDQRQRMATLDGFRDGTLRFLVASDVAARGLDIPAVSHVFNFDLPSHAEDYVHRIGRTGRAGRLGTAISIGTPADEKYLTAIESLVKAALPRSAVPDGFALSDAAQSAPRAPREGRERPGRNRRSGHNGDTARAVREDQAPREAVALPAEAATPPAPAERNNREDRRGERRDERRGERREERQDDRREPRRQDRRDDRRDRGPAVQGMGDHVPDFMLISFRPSTPSDGEDQAAPLSAAVIPVSTDAVPVTAPVAPAADIPATTEPVIEVAAPTVAAVTSEPAQPAPTEPAKPVRKRSPRSKKPPQDAAPQAEAVPAEDTAAAPVAEPVAEATPKVAATPKPRQTRSRKKAEPEAPSATSSDEPAAKPKRTRSRKKQLPDDALPEEREAVETPAPPRDPQDSAPAHATLPPDALPEEREATAAEHGDNRPAG